MKSAFRHFLETTSVKGVPKVAKSRSKCVQLLWLVALVFGLVVAAYFLVSLFVFYFKYTANLQYVERHVTAEEFPDITLCNLNPFANSPYGTTDIERLLNLAREVYNPQLRVIFQNPNFDVLDYPEFRGLLRPGKMLEFTNADPPENGYNETSNFVAYCEWDTNTGDNNCMGNAERHLYTTDFGYCFTFRHPTNATVISGFSAILYLDTFSLRAIMPAFPTGLGGVFTDGARVLVHPRGSVPLMEDGVNVEAGYHSTITLHLERRQRLGEPYSDCEHEPHLGRCWEGIDLGSSRTYGHQQCIEFCVQRQILEKCGCITGSRLSLYPMRQNVTLCGNQRSLNALEVFKYTARMLECIANIPEQTCPTDCSEDHYDIMISRSKWPHNSYHLAFYDEYIKGKTFAKWFEIDDNENDNQQGTNTSAYRNIYLDRIRQNFLRLDVLWRRSTMTVYRKEASVGVETLIGNIGGVLNLWIGITFVTIMEVIEMFVNMCRPADELQTSGDWSEIHITVTS